MLDDLLVFLSLPNAVLDNYILCSKATDVICRYNVQGLAFSLAWFRLTAEISALGGEYPLFYRVLKTVAPGMSNFCVSDRLVTIFNVFFSYILSMLNTKLCFCDSENDYWHDSGLHWMYLVRLCKFFHIFIALQVKKTNDYLT